MKMEDGLLARSPLAPGAASWWRIRIFILKLSIVILVSVVFGASRGYPPLRAIAFFCGWQSVFAGVAAVVQRHRLDADFVSAWDEMAAFLGVAELVRLIGEIVG
jgi:hypothetical protein